MNRDEIQKRANSFARKNGHGSATKIRFDGRLKRMKIGKTVRYGYRKNTTGEYVPNTYRANFGWKNTFYQHAECEVIVPRSWLAE